VGGEVAQVRQVVEVDGYFFGISVYVVVKA
jgi:hypothetical protein